MIVKEYDEIYNSMKNYIIANQDKITDFNSGSIITTMIESLARELNKLYIDTRIGYDDNLKAIPFSVFNFQKKEGQKATGKVIFYRDKPNNSKVLISKGTKVSDGVYIFETTENGEILENQTESTGISIQALEIGEEYNLSENSINVIETYISSDVTRVDNLQKITGGSKTESQNDYLNRFKDFINGLQGNNKYAIESNIAALNEVQSSVVVEHEKPKDNIFYATIYVADGSGGLSETLKGKIKTILDGDGTVSNPGLRSPGINIDIQPASIKYVSLKLKVYTKRADKTQAIFDVTKALEEEINSLRIGESLVLTSLIIKLRRISYIKDVVIIEPTSNIAIGESQIAKFESAEIEVENE